MVKKVTSAELAGLARKGTVTFDPAEQSIARFGELVDKMTQLVEQKAADTQADLARSQVQLEILATLQKSMSKRVQGANKAELAQIKTVLTQMQEAQVKPPTTYEFDIQRGPQGYISAITATPHAKVH